METFEFFRDLVGDGDGGHTRLRTLAGDAMVVGICGDLGGMRDGSCVVEG